VAATVGNPHQSLPKVFRAMDADQHEFVFHGKERRTSWAVKATHGFGGQKKFIKREPARKIAQGKIIMQLDDELRLRLREEILARDFPSVNRC